MNVDPCVTGCQALNFDSQLQKDIYVAVRVGEVQKLSKISSSRAYKFKKDAIGERRFGKVDVFKRIGSGSIGIKPEQDGEQEIRIAVGADEKIPFRVRVGSAEADIDKSAEKKSPKVQEAKQYLLEHNLEMRLSEAMQAVLREKPKDPATFISDMLLNNVNQLTRVGSPPAPAAEAAAAPDAAPAEAGQQSATEELRLKAKDILINASGDGKLDKVLGDLKGVATQGPASADLEALRVEAKGILVTASANGKLDAVLASMPGAASKDMETDALREQAKQALLDASLDGRLQKTLEQGLMPADAQVLDKLREQAKSTLLEASMNGKLEETLQAAIAETTPAPASKPLFMLPMAALYGPGFASFNITPGFIVR